MLPRSVILLGSDLLTFPVVSPGGLIFFSFLVNGLELKRNNKLLV